MALKEQYSTAEAAPEHLRRREAKAAADKADGKVRRSWGIMQGWGNRSTTFWAANTARIQVGVLKLGRASAEGHLGALAPCLSGTRLDEFQMKCLRENLASHQT